MVDSRTLIRVSLSPTLIFLTSWGRVGGGEKTIPVGAAGSPSGPNQWLQTIVSYGVAGRGWCLVVKRLALVGSPVCCKLCLFRAEFPMLVA